MNDYALKKISPFYINIFKIITKPYISLIWKYKIKNKYKIPKGEQVLILSNHQTDLDPIFIYYHFNKPLYIVATDNIFKKGITAKFLRGLGAIPKRKGLADLNCVKEMNQVIKGGGNLLFFPEGNRSYAEFQYYIPDNIAKIVKNYKITLVLFNIVGGTGVFPRFAHKKRKGKIYGEIKEIISKEQYLAMSDEELANKIKETLKVYDSEKNNLYKSKQKAEYLERMLFVCPKCQKMNSLYSKGDYLHCHNCHLEVKFNENLTLQSKDQSFKFYKLVDWYNYQKDYLKNFDFSHQSTIFEDDNISLINANPYEDRNVLAKGKMILTNNELIFEGLHFNLKDIRVASPVGGTKLVFTVNDKSYMVKGHERFNPLKYVLIFNKLDTLMKEKNIDKYYLLD